MEESIVVDEMPSEALVESKPSCGCSKVEYTEDRKNRINVDLEAKDLGPLENAKIVARFLEYLEGFNELTLTGFHINRW